MVRDVSYNRFINKILYSGLVNYLEIVIACANLMSIIMVHLTADLPDDLKYP